LEFRLGPGTVEDMKKLVKQVYKDYFAYVNKSCSIHIHISSADKSVNNLLDLTSWEFYKFFSDRIRIKYEKTFGTEGYRQLSARLNDIYCARFSDRDEFRQIVRMNKMSTRYRMINYNSFFRHKTLEFRIFPPQNTVSGVMKCLNMLVSILKEWRRKNKGKSYSTELLDSSNMSGRIITIGGRHEKCNLQDVKDILHEFYGDTDNSTKLNCAINNIKKITEQVNNELIRFKYNSHNIFCEKIRHDENGNMYGCHTNGILNEGDTIISLNRLYYHPWPNLEIGDICEYMRRDTNVVTLKNHRINVQVTSRICDIVKGMCRVLYSNFLPSRNSINCKVYRATRENNTLEIYAPIKVGDYMRYLREEVEPGIEPF